MNHYNSNNKTWNKLATAYRDKFMNLNLYDDTYDTFCNLIKKQSASVLDIGCGPGNITQYLLKKRNDFKIDAIDVAANMISLAKENISGVNFMVMDCKDISKINRKYDAIVCGFCLPYLSKDDAKKLISDCSTLLNSNGIFYISAIEDDYNKSGLETSSDRQHTMYVHCHQHDYLQQWLTESNFEMIKLSRKVYLKNDGSNSTHIIFIARKH